MMIGNNSTVTLAYNSYNSTAQALEKTTRALSTGLRAATAADDASGFAIGEKISSQVAGVDRAIRNSQDGISMLQTAEGALNEINSMLQRMRELTVQAANDTLTTQDRSYIQLEIGELRNNIDEIASSTTFNGKHLLDGSSTAIWSADDANTKVKVTGAITSLDSYGQKQATNGNYRIEIRSNAGRGQIQKTAFLEQTISEEYLDEETAANGQTVKVMKTRIRDATLEDMHAFTSPEGVFMLSEPQTIKITQGDGKTASVMLYSNDTLNDVANKINDAIANDLGQGVYTDNIKSFCTIADGTPGIEAAYSTEKVYGKIYQRDSNGLLILDEYNQPQEFLPEDYDEYLETHTTEELKALLETGLVGEKTNATMLIRSAVAGSAGKLTFTSDNNDLINALGLMTIQNAEDNVFKASIYDAHSNILIASNIESDGNTLNGVIHPNISVEFDAMANTKAVWNEAEKNYVLQNDGESYNTTVHILDRSTSFQIGQNTGEDIFINIGDMRAYSLGINGVDVSTRKNASDSIALIDAALHKINSQRSRIGSYQNELEYNTNSLRETSIHLQESESRIKDADMSREAIEFVKLQILNNTGSSMLSQANQNSKSIMSLFNL